jgi:hypothetical protein
VDIRAACGGDLDKHNGKNGNNGNDTRKNEKAEKSEKAVRLFEERTAFSVVSAFSMFGRTRL